MNIYTMTRQGTEEHWSRDKVNLKFTFSYYYQHLLNQNDDECLGETNLLISLNSSNPIENTYW